MALQRVTELHTLNPPFLCCLDFFGSNRSDPLSRTSAVMDESVYPCTDSQMFDESCFAQVDHQIHLMLALFATHKELHGSPSLLLRPLVMFALLDCSATFEDAGATLVLSTIISEEEINPPRLAMSAGLTDMGTQRH